MNEEQQDQTEDTLEQAVSIVSAYVSHNSMRAGDLPEFIAAVHASIKQLAGGQAPAEVKQPDNPAVPVKRSVNKDYLVCLEDGKRFKSLRRHLSSYHQLTPEAYRAKWNLASDYPMVAPAYSATRSQLAKDSGLGQIGRAAEAGAKPARSEKPAATGAKAADAKPGRRGRGKKAAS